MSYTRSNNLVGWGVFLVTFITYFLSVAPTASFWDCGEFIATANELEVPHPPGAPLFLMIGRVFAMLAPDVQHVAYMVNLVSVLAGAFTALFICWTTTMLARKVLAPTGQSSRFSTATILFCGAVAGLTCCFSDTVWFNAVEAEVYASSSLFTTIVFWLILKWEARADEPNHLRWIILIAFLMGLSVGVHLLNLLTIPALGLVYYFRKFKYTPAGLGIALVALIGILGFVQFFVIQNTWDLAWAFEKFFTGTETEAGKKATGLGLPYGAGAVVFTVLLLGLLVFGIWYSQRRKLVALNTACICLLMLYIGFSSYLTIIIRSAVDPPIDQNHPANVLSFLSYVKREQYGDKPLLYGQMYNSPVVGYKRGAPTYVLLPGHKRYVQEGYRQSYEYDKSSLRFFPRMFDPEHYQSGPFGYKNFVSNKGLNADDPMDDKPTGLDNMRFFWEYQVYHMYLRYFLWNFVGRASDVQHSEAESGLEYWRLKDMPEDMRQARTRNHYYALPLLLGLLGLFWHFQHDRRKAAIVGVLFLFTGLAIAVYLNQVAQEPRERDYAFVGSYHTFAIWVGLGVAAFTDLLRKRLKDASPYVAGALCLVAVPGLMAQQNWDDHSRAGVYVPPDSAFNLLNSCAQNAILFTNGDNDTFPLWYLQEVEGVRTDVRVVNLSLLNTDWYIYQLKHKQWNKSAPLPIPLDDDFFLGERNAAISFDEFKQGWAQNGVKLPFELPVNKAVLVRNGAIRPEELPLVVSPMPYMPAPQGSKERAYLRKQDLMIIYMVLQNSVDGWKRPIYFANTAGPSSYVGLGDYLELEGMAYRLKPVRDTTAGEARGMGRVNLDSTYHKYMHVYRFRGLNDPNVFFGENIERMVGNFRSGFFRLSSALLEGAEAGGLRAAEYKQKAKEVIEYGRKAISDEALPTPAPTLYLYAMIYDRLGEQAEAEKLLGRAHDISVEHLSYYRAHNLQNEDEQDYLYTLERCLQYAALGRNTARASQVAQELYTFTGDARYRSLANPAGEIPLQPEPTVADSGGK